MPSQDCPHCQRAAASTTGRYPLYNHHCIGCCARLVTSARPLRTAQESHLAAIAMREGTPTRTQILQHIKAA
jgi:hypothetical protein